MMGDLPFEDGCASDLPEELPFYFHRGNFGVIHQPVRDGLPGWVICSPFGKEKSRTHRLLFDWADELAKVGHWVLRFDYRGTGDSTGEFDGFTVHDYLEDVAAAVSQLEGISGLPCKGLIGLRLGADLAAAFLSRSERPLGLVMWEPIVSGRRYCNALLRTAMTNEMVVSKGEHRSRDELRRELRSGNSVSVDGFALTQSMYESLAEIDSELLPKPTSAPILIVHMRAGRTRAPSTRVTKLFEAYASSGDVRLENIDALPVWMETRYFKWPPDELYSTTLGWISDRHPSPRTTPSVRDRPDAWIASSESTERTVHFKIDAFTLAGILHRPTEPRLDRPNIVLLHAGDVSRSGFFYPQLARSLARMGWTVLRFDPRGLGDSRGDLGCEWLVEFFDEVEQGKLMPDAVAAFDFLERENPSSGNVLIGLCGGAVTSIYAAQADGRVRGIAPLDLPVVLFRPAVWDQQDVSWLDVFAQRESTLFLLKVHRILQDLKSRTSRLVRSLASLRSKQADNGFGGRRRYLEKLGEDANMPLLAALEGTLEKEIPVCCIFAESTAHLPNFESVLPVLRARCPVAEDSLEVRVIEGADHNFIMPGCTEKLIEVLSDWLEGPERPWNAVRRFGD